MNLRYEDALRSIHPNVILPGDPEPERLYRAAEHERVLAQIRSERAELRDGPLPRRIVSRLRTALAGI